MKVTTNRILILFGIIALAMMACLPVSIIAMPLFQQGQPAAFRELSWKMQVRLHQRGWHLLHREVMKAKVTVALARELAGFVWDLLRQVPPPKDPEGRYATLTSG
jgi:hypothetical protein